MALTPGFEPGPDTLLWKIPLIIFSKSFFQFENIMTCFAVVCRWEGSTSTPASPLLLPFRETRGLKTSLIPAKVTQVACLVICWNLSAVTSPKKVQNPFLWQFFCVVVLLLKLDYQPFWEEDANLTTPQTAGNEALWLSLLVKDTSP